MEGQRDGAITVSSLCDFLTRYGDVDMFLAIRDRTGWRGKLQGSLWRTQY